MTQYPFQPTLTDRLMVRALRKCLPQSHHQIFNTALLELLNSEGEYLTDRATNSQIMFVATVLCLYRNLRGAGHSDHEARAIIRQSLRGLGKRTTAFLMWFSFLFSRDRLQTIRKYSRMKAQHAYGPSFQFSESDIDGGFVSEVHICGYRTFLARHHALDLTEVLCEWDRVWIEALPKGIAFQRPTTLALGGKSCRFEIRRE